ncbi:MAG TPA: hypothetical protein VNB30_06950 [Rhizomicrobium sp.]|jgi:hypothetical protein|nr:hypothetical protein [Rhizomicrobium sp.]
MADHFTPDGYLRFDEACDEAARLVHGPDLAAELSASEASELANYAQFHMRKYPRDTNPGDSGLAPERIALLIKRGRVRTKQIAQSRRTLRQKLYSGAIKSWVLSSAGELEPVRRQVWGGKAYNGVTKSGRLLFTVKRGDNGRVTEGPVLIRLADLARYFKRAAKSTDRARGANLRVRPGRPPLFDWDEIWVEVIRIIHEEGPPKTRAELTRRIQLWHADKHGREPSDEVLKPKMSVLFRRLKFGAGP